MPDSERKVLLDVQGLKTYFSSGHGRRKHVVKAVDDVSFRIFEGETFGLVGESGSGKSTIGKAILRYHEPTSGEIFYDGTEIGHMKEKDLLRTTSMKTAEIAFAVGYKDSHYFSYLFKKTQECTPREFRARV